MPPLGQLYFEWLYSQVASVKNQNISRTYDRLFEIFFTKEFIWSHPRDANFAQYGIDLRADFLREMPFSADDDPGFMHEACSVFELLIALAKKLAFDDIEERDLAYWFWEMIENLGLKAFNDAKFRSGRDEAYIHGVLDKVLNREYDSKGNGGLFPLRQARKNQRKEDLLYQAEAYLAESVQ